MHKSEFVLENETQDLVGFCDANGSPNPNKKTRPSDKKEDQSSSEFCHSSVG